MLYFIAPIILKLNKHLNALVSPQLGHGKPTIILNIHGTPIL